MKVTLNDTHLECAEVITLAALLASVDRLHPSTALAVNNTIVPRDQWETHLVCAEDDILLFQAIAGG